MSNSNSSKQVLLSVIGVAILVVAVVGVSFAFFNYTRTGPANTIRTGTISFNTTNSVINISNLFPMAKTAVNSTNTNVGVGEVTITGHTNYVNGIDFTITAESVSDSIGTTAGKLPVSIKVVATDLGGVKAYGSDTGSMTVNSFEDGTTIESGSVIASGRIPANANIDGKLTIMAYLDQSNVAITDTLASGEIEVPGYTNGTTSTWVNGRTVMTTEEWNALVNTAASFKIKVVANEGS